MLVMAVGLTASAANLMGSKAVCLVSDYRLCLHGKIMGLSLADLLALFVLAAISTMLLTSAAIALDHATPKCATTIAKCI